MGAEYFAAVVLLFCITLQCFGGSGLTNSKDGVILMALKSEWQNTPPNWRGADPCGFIWQGVNCTDSEVTLLNLSNMNISGTLASDIGSLVGLRALDLSYNKGLTGPIPISIGNLINLETLIAIGCGFTGQIPNELGNLKSLTFLALNSNNLSGEIPSSLGNLAKLYWLDLSDNQLTGSLPASNGTKPGLDKLVNAKHFHLGKNRLTGSIPAEIFHSRMQLIHVLFDSNEFEGKIPSTLGLVQTLEVVRLNRNSLDGQVPPNISNLKHVSELHLSNNKLEGPVPDFSELTRLQYVDLSNNSFGTYETPRWFTTLKQLTTLIMENCGLKGQLPSELFDLPDLETVRLRNNFFSGTLKINPSVSPQLKLIDLRNNNITWAIQQNDITIMLLGNPACNSENGLSSTESCRSDGNTVGSYFTNLTVCSEDNKCSGQFKPNPRTCQCQVPYEGELIFRSPLFSDLSDSSRFKLLEDTLQTELLLDSVVICCLNFDSNDYLNMKVQFFLSDNMYFGRMEIARIGSALSNQIYKPPAEFGSYFFIGYSYPYLDTSKSNSSRLNSRAIISISVVAVVVALGMAALGFYALGQKSRAEKAIQFSNRFGREIFCAYINAKILATEKLEISIWIMKEFVSETDSSDTIDLSITIITIMIAWWEPSGELSGQSTPRLKGARWFSFVELKKATDNFSDINEIGSGGCGKVYKGILYMGGEIVAIKRIQQGISQAGAEFKNEVEILSRVHHRNLVGLIGFCFEKGEQILVYEYISNGTLRENLCGRMGMNLDWRRRLQIALGSARGLSYLHEHANPPIIHRDVKSTNILLDDNLIAKVADFGLSKLFVADHGGKDHISTQVKGTLGYLDPEYYTTHHLSDKSDVYSFGVVLMELITARPPIEGGKYIVREVRRTLDTGGINDFCEQLMDPLLRKSPDDVHRGIESFIRLALRCVEDVTAHRPAMSAVVKELESIADPEGLHNYATTSRDGSIGRKEPCDSMNLFDYSGPYIVPSPVEPQ
eukprot:Gb_10155 [translate_table: standard]